MNPCPSELELEKHLARPSPPLAQHLGSCGRCGARLEQMQEEGQDFLQHVFPATVSTVAAARRPSFDWRWLTGLGLAAASVVAVLGLSLAAREGAYVGTKGALALAVFAESDGRVFQVEDGQPLSAHASLRFRVQGVAGCHLLLVSLDQSGTVSPLFSSEGKTPQGSPPQAGGELPGGAVLDGQSGPERVYAVCSEEPISFRELERTLRDSLVKQGALQGVRSMAEIPALRRARQSSVLLEKIR